MATKVVSKSKVWKKAGGVGPAPKVKGMSKREIWSTATGKKKTKAPSYTKSVPKVSKGVKTEMRHMDRVQADRVKGGVNPYEEMINFKK